MANANIPQGLRPVRDGSNRMWTGGGNTYNVASNYGTAIYVGDPVILTGEADANGIPTVALATAGSSNRITGVVVGVQIINSTSPAINGGPYIPATTGGYLIVEDDPNVLYEVQASTLAAADIGQNSILASGSGSRITGSGWYMDTGTKGTATYQLRIVGVAQRPDNALGTYCKTLVRLNTPTEAGLATGTGI